MGRIWLTVILPLLLPTLLYVASVSVMRQGRRAAMQKAWPWLLAAGAIFSGCVLAAAWFRSGGGDNGNYVPPHVLDGRVVPGRLVPPETPAR